MAAEAVDLRNDYTQKRRAARKPTTMMPELALHRT